MGETCQKCMGVGMRLVQRENGDRFAEPCTCRIERRAERMLVQARVPRRYRDCSLDSYETAHHTAHASLKKALSMARRFSEGFPVETAGKGLLLIGSSGLGKTHLSVSILKNLIAERGVSGVFWEHKELLDHLRSIYSNRTPGAEDKLLRFLTTCDILVLDDLGDITPSDWTWDTTSYILNSRYNENLSTIITTNLQNEGPAGMRSEVRDTFAERSSPARETLGDRIGERMRSRLQEMCVLVEMKGEDFRHRVKRARFA